MTLPHKFTLAARYLLNHFRRYVFLAVAIALGFGVITTMTGLASGMANSVRSVAEQHYAGHLFVTGFLYIPGKDNQQLVQETEAVEAAIAASGIPVEKLVYRTTCFKEGTLFFAGNAARQKYIYGVDWDNETEHFRSLDYTDGGPEGLTRDGKAILISKPIAEKLHVRVGDSLTVQVNTLTGQRNTGTFVVRGIFDDTSLFGYYKSYIDRRDLNALLNTDPADYSAVGIYFPPRTDRKAMQEKLYEELAVRLTMAPPINDKDEYHKYLVQSWDGIRHFLVDLDVFVSQISELILAMRLISYLLYFMIVLIILVSITITYRLVIRERIKEIGTMRALGILRRDLRDIFFLEGVLLYIVSIIAGWILALAALFIISRLSFSQIPGIEIFLHQGRLKPSFSLGGVLINMAILFVINAPAVYIPSNRAAKMTVCTALAHD